VGLKQLLESVPVSLFGNRALLTTLTFLRMAPCETPGLTGGRTLSKGELHHESDRVPRAVSQLASTEAEGFGLGFSQGKPVRTNLPQAQ
jgi:hypothetical protein